MNRRLYPLCLAIGSLSVFLTEELMLTNELYGILLSSYRHLRGESRELALELCRVLVNSRFLIFSSSRYRMILT